ncbi:MAG TPA: ABC transporter ATP-binding protein [Candidatus Dormibacteraeota bacterium]|nr:ABC transporter ATP-binding protein [Candidatus Dormibacteraeota bacterium]
MTQAVAAPATLPASGPDVLVRVEGLTKYYPIYGGLLRRKLADVKAVDGVSFEVRRGEVFGLVGESGCGKSTLGKTLIRLQPPTAGAASIANEDIFAKRGQDLKRLRRRMQIIFQDPVGSLNPRMPISDIIGEGLLAQATRENRWGDRKVRDKRVEDYLQAVGLRRDYTRRYPHEFSGGQRQRIGIARALALDPEFVVCDEPVSALDVSIQSQILNLLLDLRREFNLTYLFIAHNLSVVQYISDRVGVMYLGKLVEMGDVEQLYLHPRHPYTVALLSAVPDPDPRIRKKRIVLKGDVPSPAAPPSGCRFHTRCWLRERLGNPENCETIDPEFRDIGAGHRVACHWAEEIPDTVVRQAVAVAPTDEADGSADAAAASEATTAGASPASPTAGDGRGPFVPTPPEAPQGAWGHGAPGSGDGGAA